MLCSSPVCVPARSVQEAAVRLRPSDPKKLVARAAVEDGVAEKAACTARKAEARGRPDLADSLWRLVRHNRVQSLMFRAKPLHLTCAAVSLDRFSGGSLSARCHGRFSS